MIIMVYLKPPLIKLKNQQFTNALIEKVARPQSAASLPCLDRESIKKL